MPRAAQEAVDLLFHKGTLLLENLSFIGNSRAFPTVLLSIQPDPACLGTWNYSSPGARLDISLYLIS